jgi:hypothetical protein
MIKDSIALDDRSDSLQAFFMIMKREIAMLIMLTSKKSTSTLIDMLLSSSGISIRSLGTGGMQAVERPHS